ncbi:MAG TPA: NYN domain-containing protein [Candidatus Cloacimonadota bacterium]|nr:NYN domain-containing protein [Candidatus Cloacimonadota bacterium]
MKATKDIRIAVLIDADNIPSANIRLMMEEIAKYGTPTFKRIYGDWTKPNLNSWKTILLENAITPIQQYGYTTGKNATDSAMIIDAMDILYTEKVDAFCIVSSDSDFTRLATRLRESGMMVIGLGEKKTPNPFIVACDKFIYIEILSIPSDESVVEDEQPNGKKNTPTKKQETLKKIDKATINVITSTISDLADDDGWAFLGEVGNLILKKQPDFDPRNFGFTKLAMLIKSISKFAVDERETEKKNIKLVYVRVKK